MLTPLLNLCNMIAGNAQSDYDAMLKKLYSHTVPVISTDELQELILNEDIVLLDTRSAEEYQVSHLTGAYFIDYKNFEIASIDPHLKNKNVVVYCSVGYRSEKIGEKLINAGFKSVHNLYGGIFQWVNKESIVVDNNNQPTDSVHTYNKRWSKWLERGVKVYE